MAVSDAGAYAYTPGIAFAGTDTFVVAVGGAWLGPPDAGTPWPATLLVDSFRFTPAG